MVVLYVCDGCPEDELREALAGDDIEMVLYEGHTLTIDDILAEMGAMSIRSMQEMDIVVEQLTKTVTQAIVTSEQFRDAVYTLKNPPPAHRHPKFQPNPRGYRR